MPTPLTHLLNVLPASAFLASLRGEIVYANEAMTKLMGTHRNPSAERTVFGLGLFSNHAEFRGFLRGFETVGPLQRVRLPTARLQNHQNPAILSAVLHDAGTARYVIGVISMDDSTPSQTTVVASGANWNDLPYFLFSTNGRGQLISANTTTRALMEVAQNDDVSGLSMAGIDANFSRSAWEDALATVRRTGDHEYETIFRRPNGTIVPVCVTLSRVEGYPAKRVTVAAHDISPIRRLEGDLRSALLDVVDLKRKRERDELQQRRSITSGQAAPAIISQSKSYLNILNQIKQVAPTDSTVLVTGETGTGKELVAKNVHAASKRASEPFIVVNCGALPKDLIESELFGHRKGAFTGAIKDQVGRFKLADEGTLFLDEIGEMPLDLQTRLLRFLQEGEFSPVGSQDTVYANVRVVAATNRNLMAMVREKTFRADLYFRLNVFPIHNIPLRERTEDIPLLIDHFIAKHSRRLNSDITGYHPSVLQRLKRYSFPGNVRELENIVERAIITSPGPTLMLDVDFSAALPDISSMGAAAGAENGMGIPGDLANGFDAGPGPVLTFEDMQRKYIEQILEMTDGKVSGEGGAAELLGLKPQTLFSKIRKLGVKK